MRYGLFAKSKKCYSILPLLLATYLSGCTFHLVAPYNSEDQTAIEKISIDVITFYEKLLIEDPQQRRFNDSKTDYAKIDGEMRVLSIREESFEKNGSSVETAHQILLAWERTRDKHKNRDQDKRTNLDQYPDPDLVLDRNNFAALFQIMLKDEESKKTASGISK